MAVRPTTMTLDAAMSDVEARFLYNLPENELSSPERLFFQIEQAYWYYEDFKADRFKNLPHFSSLKSFAQNIFQHCELLKRQQTTSFQQLFADYASYKAKIPVCGCILLNKKMNKILLVCDYNTNSWMFPRGKINQSETELQCAIRETAEETGFNAAALCNEHDFITSFQNQKKVQLFIAANVPEDTHFECHTRKEVSKIEFHPLDNLPSRTYHVQPFIQSLKRWINKRQKAENGNGPNAAAASMGNTPGTKSMRLLTRNGTSKLIVPVSVKANKSAAAADKTIDSTEKTIALKSSADSNKSTHSSKKKMTPSTLTAVAQLKKQKQQQQQQQVSTANGKEHKGFDARNVDTFAGQSDRWSVQQMFQANAQLTGKQYDYNGNPHAFGASHPRYVNYNAGATHDEVLAVNPVGHDDDAFLQFSLQSRKVGEKLLRGVEYNETVNVLNETVENEALQDKQRTYFALPFVVGRSEVMNAVNQVLEARPVRLTLAL